MSKNVIPNDIDFQNEKQKIEKYIVERDNVLDMKRANIGGTGYMYFVTINGEEYLYKPAVARWNGKVKRTARAYAQEGAYRLQRFLDSETAVPCYAVSLNGEIGTVQKFIKHGKLGENDAINVLSEFHNGRLNNLTKSQLYDIMREYIVDWTIGNFDTFYGNMIIDEFGRVRGIDKEQAFKYIYERNSHKPNIEYDPNKIYGQPTQIYSLIFQKILNRTLKVDGHEFSLKDMNELSKYTIGLAEKVSNIDDNSFIGLPKNNDGRYGYFAQFVQTIQCNNDSLNKDFFFNFVNQNGKDIGQQLLDRKNNMPKCMGEFFNKIMDSTFCLDNTK